MSAETILIASDHAGYEMKQHLAAHLRAKGFQVEDLGTEGTESVDYPDFGIALAEAVAAGKAPRGVLVCGTGIGISIAANRNPAVRAALCSDVTSARLSRQHNDANEIALGARLIGPETAVQCLDAFLETPFEGGRHQRRVDKLGA
ncbi:MAG: ribose 5-phosphate isomerase B [Limibacillus sp.]